MKILLINPNRYRMPPVPPLGLEYLVAPLLECGHEVQILDLCFSDSVHDDCVRALVEFRPGVAGITVRNIDSGMYPKTEFFLPGIRDIVRTIKDCGIPVIAGGAGFSVAPEATLSFIGADFGVAGPGEGALPAFMRDLERGRKPDRISEGRLHPFDLSLPRRRAYQIDYGRYIPAGAVAGFEMQKGCPEACIYCVEAGTPHVLKPAETVLREIEFLVDLGFRAFHLCDCEFNIDLDASIGFLKTLKAARLGIRWSLYVKPEPVSGEMFELLRESGADVVTLTANSYEFGRPEYAVSLSRCIRHAAENGISLAIDLLAGFPFESADSLMSVLDFFMENRPKSVGLNYHLRVYPGTAMMDYCLRHPEIGQYMVGSGEGNPDFLFPVFYRHPSMEAIIRKTGGDSLFRIEGIEEGTNYQRLQSQVQ